MKYNILIFTGILFAFASCDSSKTGSSDFSPELKTQIDTVSYMLGYNGGKGLEAQGYGEELNREAFFGAINEGLAGEESKIDLADANKVMQEYSQVLREKQLEKRTEEAEENLEKGKAFLEKNGKKSGVFTTESGLQYEIIEEGNGAKPTATDRITVHYHGTTLDGEVFDSSVDRDEPMTRALNSLIKGWIEGIQLMPVGAKYKFYIPADLAYGERGSRSIGPNETLIFDVELIDIEAADQK